MYPRSLGSNFVPRSPRVGLRVIHASAVPGALHAIPGDDLDEAARPYVVDFDELAVKRRMYGGCQATRSAVPSHSIIPV